MKRTVQVLAAHCVLKRCADIVIRMHDARCTHLPCPLSRQGTAAAAVAAHLHAKPAPALRHAHHCSICGAASHSHTHTHTSTAPCTPLQRLWGSKSLTHAHICTHSHTHIHTHTHTHTQTHTHTNTHTHTYSACPILVVPTSYTLLARLQS